MRYEVIMEKNDYALILRGTRMEEYAVVYQLDKVKVLGHGLVVM